MSQSDERELVKVRGESWLEMASLETRLGELDIEGALKTLLVPLLVVADILWPMLCFTALVFYCHESISANLGYSSITR